MKIAISGGTGFIGGELARALSQAGHDVVVLTRHPGSQEGSLPPRVTEAFFDADQPLPPGNLGGAQAVVNLAGETVAQRWTDGARRRILDSRLNGTSALVKAAIEAGTVRTFVSASAVGYYGDRGAEPVTEASPPGEDFLARVCRSWEAAALPASSAGMRLVILRIGVVLHPDGGALSKMAPLFRLGLGGRLGSGEQYMSWINRSDLVRLFAFALENGSVQGPLNAVSPNPVTNKDFTRAMGRALHRPALLPAPSIAVKVALGEMAETLLGGQRVVPHRPLDLGFKFERPDLEQALKQLS